MFRIRFYFQEYIYRVERTYQIFAINYGRIIQKSGMLNWSFGDTS
jgi:hypothetical protein